MIRGSFGAALFALLLTASGAHAASTGYAIQHARSGLAGDAAPVPEDQGGPGFLTVTTDPPAKLSVDGADTGKTTPVTKLSLAAGKHKITLTSLDGKTKRSLGVTIVAGEEKRLTVSL